MPKHRKPDKAVIALVLVAIAAGYGQFGAVASMNEVAHYFGQAHGGNTIRDIVGLSGSVLGVSLSVLRIASLAALPLASLADRWGRKKVLRRVAIAGLLLTAMASGSPSYWSFVAFFALARPLLSATTTLLQVVTVELASVRTRASRLALIAAGVGGGAGLSAVLHGLLPGANAFRILFATAALPALLVAPLLTRVPEPVRHTPLAEEFVARLGAIPRTMRKQLATVMLITVSVSIITGPANGFAFLYGEGVLNISRHEVAIVVLIGSMTGLGGLLLGRWLADRIGRRATIAIGTLASACASVLAYSGGRTSFIIGFLAGVPAAAILAPAASALANEIFPHEVRATAGGWVVVAGVCGAVIGLVAFGYSSDVLPIAHQAQSFRIPALLTFLPGLPMLLLLRTLPESRGTEIS